MTAGSTRLGGRRPPLTFAAVTREELEPPDFSLDVGSDGDGRTTVAVTGELDIASVDEFSRAVAGSLAIGPVLLDLRGVTFMDSTGVRALNTALRAASEHGQELRVAAGLQPAVDQILELTGMLGLLSLEEERP